MAIRRRDRTRYIAAVPPITIDTGISTTPKAAGSAAAGSMVTSRDSENPIPAPVIVRMVSSRLRGFSWPLVASLE